MITLPPLAEIKRLALEALNAGTLQCQRPDFQPLDTACDYAGPCAIGVALALEDAKILDDRRNRENRNTSIANLLHEGVVKINPADAPDVTREVLAQIQNNHDWRDLDRLRRLLES